MVLDPQVISFFAGLKSTIRIFRSTKRDMDLHLATDFNVFDYISPSENRMSDVIRDLLDPKSGHGQGAVFLDALLEIVGQIGTATWDSVDTKPLGIEREAMTTHIERARRMDIRLDFGTAGITIENKPWASELPSQSKDYIRELKGRFGERFHFVYLSRSGERPPSVIPEEWRSLLAKHQASAWSYSRELKKWLATCQGECRSEKVRWFLTDFCAHIDGNLFATPLDLEEDVT